MDVCCCWYAESGTIMMRNEQSSSWWLWWWWKDSVNRSLALRERFLFPLNENVVEWIVADRLGQAFDPLLFVVLCRCRHSVNGVLAFNNLQEREREKTLLNTNPLIHRNWAETLHNTMLHTCQAIRSPRLVNPLLIMDCRSRNMCQANAIHKLLFSYAQKKCAITSYLFLLYDTHSMHFSARVKHSRPQAMCTLCAAISPAWRFLSKWKTWLRKWLENDWTQYWLYKLINWRNKRDFDILLEHRLI